MTNVTNFISLLMDKKTHLWNKNKIKIYSVPTSSFHLRTRIHNCEQVWGLPDQFYVNYLYITEDQMHLYPWNDFHLIQFYHMIMIWNVHNKTNFPSGYIYNSLNNSRCYQCIKSDKCSQLKQSAYNLNML